ncbi:MAG TPA: threonine--tRNA ligase [Chloroflexi bacterium]|nr:MAG: threonine--tRNA ligase [Chloroflexota bacterium]HDD54894.1 threonine--tRNA ligase [Chloroflexota bacterium]
MVKDNYLGSDLWKIRHSAAHVMAQAVRDIFPEGAAKIAIGPPIADGFYYDFDLPRPLTPEDLEEIEGKMRKVLTEDHQFIRRELSAEEARELFRDQPYKLDLIDGLEAGGVDEYGEPLEEETVISTYTHDDFEDLCRGPHVESTQRINPKAIKLLNVAGAYWRGDERNPMLQRIYGTAWETEAELEDYLAKLEEAKRRDHRRLGKELDLYSTNPDVGSGLVLWHPNGAYVRYKAEQYCQEEHLKNGYEFVVSPHIGKAHLWETSGHLTWYEENMYSSLDIDQESYYLKPMNCPFHIMIYKNSLHSYRDLPLRWAEWGTVYRYERSGVLHGMMRVRGFTQDDAHIFCSPDQMPGEIDRVLNFCLHILRGFGMNEFHAYLATRDPDKSAGDVDRWDDATEALRETLDRAGLHYDIDEGGAAFYGPKIDLKMIDALDREWQLSTIQFDFNLPDRFDLTYIGEDGKQHRPYMIHRALLGSIERFIGVLVEHYSGAFPLWLAPTQAILIPITDRNLEYVNRVAEQMRAAGIQVKVDDSSDRMGAKIRDAEKLKIPYMLVVGDREQEAGTVAPRLRSGDQLDPMPVEDLLARMKEEIQSHAQI